VYGKYIEAEHVIFRVVGTALDLYGNVGVSANNVDIIAAGYRSSCAASACVATSRTACTSSGDNVSLPAAIFSSRYIHSRQLLRYRKRRGRRKEEGGRMENEREVLALIFFVPGIRMMSSPCASNHASVPCPAV
jgi:hypothetical protein